jgi:maltose alpha-D-glucosyltransferase/alpha-amylase
VVRRGVQPLFVTIVDVEFDDGGREQYFLPLTIRPTADAKGLVEQSPHAVLANVTGARKGVLFDAWLDDTYARTLLNMIERQEQMATKRGTIRAAQSRSFPRLHGGIPHDAAVMRMGVEQSNTSIVYANRLILKLFRRLQGGINPDLEIGLQLTERAAFSRVPTVAGWFVRRALDAPTWRWLGLNHLNGPSPRSSTRRRLPARRVQNDCGHLPPVPE